MKVRPRMAEQGPGCSEPPQPEQPLWKEGGVAPIRPPYPRRQVSHPLRAHSGGPAAVSPRVLSSAGSTAETERGLGRRARTLSSTPGRKGRLQEARSPIHGGGFPHTHTLLTTSRKWERAPRKADSPARAGSSSRGRLGRPAAWG